MLTSIVISILSILVVSNETVPACNESLLKAYISPALNRSLMAITDNQKTFCPHMESTCCTDEEFEILKKEIKDRAQNLKEFTEIAQATVEAMSKASDELFIQTFNQLDSKTIPFDLEQLKSKLEELRIDSSDFILRMEAAIRFNAKTFDGYICGVCDGDHHQSVSKTLSLNDMDCFDLLREKDFFEFGAFTQDMLILNQFAFILNSTYGANMTFQENQLKGIGILKALDVEYYDPDEFLKDPEFFQGKCEQFATKNLAPLQEYFSAMATAFVLIQDFCLDQKIYNQFMSAQVCEINNEENQNKKVSSDSDKKWGLAGDNEKIELANQALLSEIEKIKPKSDSVLISKDPEFALEKMEVDYVNKGWSNIKYGFYKFKQITFESDYDDFFRNTSSLDILGIGLVLGFVLMERN